MSIYDIAGLCFGIVIGWCVRSFLFRSPTKNIMPAALTAIVTALGGGAIWQFLAERSSAGAYYAIGVFVGFVVWIILALLALRYPKLKPFLAILRVVKQSPPPPPPRPPVKQFTAMATSVLERASYLAKHNNLTEVGTAHTLEALKDCPAVKAAIGILLPLDTKRGAFDQAVTAAVTRKFGLESSNIEPVPSKRLEEAKGAAFLLASELGHSQAGTGHLFYGISAANSEEDLGKKVMVNQNLSPESVKEVVSRVYATTNLLHDEDTTDPVRNSD